jgi:hypothetical protein
LKRRPGRLFEAARERPSLKKGEDRESGTVDPVGEVPEGQSLKALLTLTGQGGPHGGKNAGRVETL